ncbi:MAG: peptidylprolyl isomerase [Armatimonadota bacterium]
MSMLTRSLIGLSLLFALLLISVGCQKQVAVKPQPLFPSGTQAVPVTDPTLKVPEAPKPPEAQKPPEPPKPQQGPKPETGKWQPPVASEIALARRGGTQHAVIKTARGDIEVELYGTETPRTVANFVKLASAKFYDGLIFHRVLDDPGFSIAQGGDPAGDGTGGPGYSIERELSPKLKHVEGALAMARSEDPDSAGSQFYICRGAIPELDQQYAVFGKVTKGLDVAKKIQQGDKIISIRLKK